MESVGCTGSSCVGGSGDGYGGSYVMRLFIM